MLLGGRTVRTATELNPELVAGKRVPGLEPGTNVGTQQLKSCGVSVVGQVRSLHRQRYRVGLDPGVVVVAGRLLEAWEANPGPSGLAVGSAVAAASHAHEEARRNPHLELVVSGPGSQLIEARRTEQVLLEWIGKATREILLVTFAPYMYDDLRKALVAAAARGVDVTVLTEDPQDNPDFTGILRRSCPGLIAQRLRWPAEERPETGAALHAKLAVIDGSTAFITSANLTKRAAGNNLEAGVLIRGGDLPERLSAHVRELRQQGRLTPS